MNWKIVEVLRGLGALGPTPKANARGLQKWRAKKELCVKKTVAHLEF